MARQVANAIAKAIADRQLAAGDALPSSRDLAGHFNVARNTVLSALAVLSDDGLIVTKPGMGSFVAPQTASREVSDHRTDPTFAITKWAQRLPQVTTVVEPDRGMQYDCRPGLPDLQTIPFDEWRRSAVRKLKTLRTLIGSYGEPEGDIELRQEIGRYVARSRGVKCGTDNLIVTSGAQQAFDLIARVLVEPGISVAVEEPGYSPASQAFIAAGAVVHPVPVGNEGIEVDLIPTNVSLVYVTPSHQYPLGVTMSTERRTALLRWAAEADGIIVEDDYDSEFQYTPGGAAALQAADSAGRVIYVGTFSKNLMPGIRLGYLVAPHPLHERLVKAKWLADRHSDNISQSVLAEFMSSGQFGRHITRMRAIYEERNACLHTNFDKLANKGLDLLPNTAGLHACAILRSGIDESTLIDSAANVGVGLYGLRQTFLGNQKFQGIIFGFGNLDTRGIERSIERIINLL